MTAINDAAALPFRVLRLEDRIDAATDDLKVVTDKTTKHEENIKQLSIDITKLSSSVNRLTGALIGFSLTLAGSAVAYVLTSVG